MTTALAPALPDPADALTGPRSVAPGSRVAHVLTHAWPQLPRGHRPALCGHRAHPSRWRSVAALGAPVEPCVGCSARLPGSRPSAPVRIGRVPDGRRWKPVIPPTAPGPQTQAGRAAARAQFAAAWELSEAGRRWEAQQLADLLARGAPIVDAAQDPT